MSEAIDRFNVDQEGLIIDESGEFMRYIDYEKLERELNALKAKQMTEEKARKGITADDWRRIAGRLYARLVDALSKRQSGQGEESGAIWPGSVDDTVLREFKKMEALWKN